MGFAAVFCSMATEIYRRSVISLQMKILGTNIISLLGFTTLDNFEQVESGVSGIKYYETGTFDLVPCAAGPQRTADTGVSGGA